MDELTDPKVKAIVKAIAHTENGGAPDLENPKAGKTGEVASIFQFEPGTWKQYSKEAFGRDDIQMNPDTETYVVGKKVKKWLDEGKTNQQIYSMWNAGASEPDAYSGKFSNGSSSNGVNKKYNVKFDVPGYVNKASGYEKQFLDEKPEEKTGVVDSLKSILDRVKGKTDIPIEQTPIPYKEEPLKPSTGKTDKGKPQGLIKSALSKKTVGSKPLNKLDKQSEQTVQNQ